MSLSSPEPRQVVQLDLSVGSLHTVLIDGQPHVVLRPAVESLGLDWKNQHEKLKTRSWARVVQQTMQLPGEAQARTYSLAPVRTFLMLLATINENRVAESARPTLVAFQNETADAIEAYWTQGGAVNASYVEAMARTELARMTGAEPDIDPLDMTVTCEEFLAEAGVAKAQMRSARTRLGKTVAALYRARYGRDPQKIQRPIDGVHRDVSVYTVRDRDLFETAWSELARHYDVQGVLGGVA